mmetsp:Transcript_78066/g.210212  ORF Transcript_78066/g.210212 Transcript_78066/m.210212 type:complete len:118 (+) Transcript_78066:2-355(+)
MYNMRSEVTYLASWRYWPWSAGVARGTPEVLRDDARWRSQTLLLCWPDMESGFAEHCLDLFPGTRLVYVGEGAGGCTASAGFFRRLARGWTLQDSRPLGRFPGYEVEDAAHVYVRKG